MARISESVYADSVLEKYQVSSPPLVGPPDDTWTSNSTSNSWWARVSMPDLKGKLVNTQYVYVQARKNAALGPDPTLYIDLYENGAFKKTLKEATVTVSDSAGQSISASFSPADLTGLGDEVEILVETVYASDATGTKRGVEAEHIRWLRTYDEPKTTSILPKFTQTSSATFVKPDDIATGASTLPKLTQSADAVNQAPVSTGSATSPLGSLTQDLGSTSTPPVMSGDVQSTLGSLTQAADATFFISTWTGTAASSLPALTQAGSADHSFIQAVTQTLYAESVIAHSACVNPANGVGTSDDVWTGNTLNEVWWARYAMPTPSGSLSGAQDVSIKVRKSADLGPNPRVRSELWDNGVHVADIVPLTDVTNHVSQTFTGSFNASQVSSGANVEIRVYAIGDVTTTLERNVQLDSVRWVARIIDQTGATAASTLPALTQSVDATSPGPFFTGTTGSVLGLLSQALVADYTLPDASASIESVLPLLTQAAVVDTARPVGTSNAASVMAALTQDAAGTFALDGVVVETQVLYAQSTIQNSYCVNANNALFAADNTYTGNTENTTWSATWAMQNPEGPLTGTQTIRVDVRKSTDDLGPNPEFKVELWDNGVKVRDLISRRTVTANAGSYATGTFEAPEVSYGDNVEIKVIGYGASDLTLQRNIQLDAVTWTAQYAIVHTSTGHTQSPLPALIQDAAGTFVKPVDTASVVSTLPLLVQAADGIFDATRDGAVTSTLPLLTQAAAGTFYTDAYATAASTLPKLTQAAVSDTSYKGKPTTQRLYASDVDVSNGCIASTQATYATDGTYTGNTEDTVWDARWNMQDPAGPIVDTQTITVRARKSADLGTNPTLRGELWENGVKVRDLFATTFVSATGTAGQDIVATFPATDINDGKLVQVYLVGDGVGGTVTPRNVQIDSITWDATVLVFRSATGESALPALTQDANGTFLDDDRTATAASTLPSLTQAAQARRVRVATATSTLDALTQSVVVDYTAPPGTRSAATLPSLTQDAAATHSKAHMSPRSRKMWANATVANSSCVLPQNAHGQTDGSWTNNTDSTTWAARWGMENPGGTLTGTQTVTVTVRKSAALGPDPYFRLDLYENGKYLKSLIANTTVTSTSGVTYSGTFLSSEVSSPYGENVEFRVYAVGQKDLANTQRNIQVDSIEWTGAAYITRRGPIEQTLPSLAQGMVVDHQYGRYTATFTSNYPSITAPHRTGSATSPLGSLSGSADASFAKPVYNATVTGSLGSITQQLHAAFDKPVYQGTMPSVLLPLLTQSAAGEHEKPVWTGSLTGTFAAITQDVTATFTKPVDVGTAAQTLASLDSTLLGTTTKPKDSGAVQSHLGPLSQTATGDVEYPRFFGTMSQVLPTLTQGGTLDYDRMLSSSDTLELGLTEETHLQVTFPTISDTLTIVLTDTGVRPIRDASGTDDLTNLTVTETSSVLVVQQTPTAADALSVVITESSFLLMLEPVAASDTLPVTVTEAPSVRDYLLSGSDILRLSLQEDFELFLELVSTDTLTIGINERSHNAPTVRQTFYDRSRKNGRVTTNEMLVRWRKNGSKRG